MQPVSLTFCISHMLSTTKAYPLPYKWPLLEDNQDPSSPEARLAFHLHRLNLTGAPLRSALHGKSRISTALTQARMSISVRAMAELAVSLNIPAYELTRELTEQESGEWEFYRNSAQNRFHVWTTASAHWRDHGLSDREAANIIGMDHADVMRSMTGKRTKIFSLVHAHRLSAATGGQLHPDFFLPNTDPFGSKPER